MLDYQIVKKLNILSLGKTTKIIDGKQITFESLIRAPGVRILLQDKEKILLTREYRYNLDEWDYRLPGGKSLDNVDDYLKIRDDKDAIQQHAHEAAQRELREEVGIHSNHLQLADIKKCGTTIEWDLYYFICKDFTQLPKRNLEAGEDIEFAWHNIQKVREMCLDGKVAEGRTCAFLLQYLKDY